MATRRHKRRRQKRTQRGRGRNGNNDNINVEGLHQVNLNLLNSNAGHNAFAVMRARQSIQQEILRLEQKLGRLQEIVSISESPRLKKNVQGNIDKVKSEIGALRKNVSNVGYHVSEALHGSNTRHYPNWY
jgi:t-SNARE complex subunit (syntaxin)